MEEKKKTDLIIPAIMPKDHSEVEYKVGLVKDYVNWIQVDVMDGKFVPAITWPYLGGVSHKFDDMVSAKTYLPYNDEISYEIDLMVEEPVSVIKDWIDLGAKRITVHKAYEDVIRSCGELCKEHGVELGIAVHIQQSLTTITPLVPYLDYVQCMGVSRVGYTGESFDKNSLKHVDLLQRHCPGLIIQIDGAAGIETIPRLRDVGADRYIAQSAIYGSDSIEGAITRLDQLARGLD